VRFLPFALARETAGAARTRSSLRPLLIWANDLQTSRERRGEIAKLCLPLMLFEM
jgi:hypothetical protein